MEHDGDVVLVRSEALHLCKNADVGVMNVLHMTVAALLLAVLLISACSTDEPRSVQRGREVFAEYCVRCHGADGMGTEGVPAIRTSPLMRQDLDSLIGVLAYGKESRYGQGTHRAMPPIPYSAADIAAVASFIRQEFGMQRDTVAVPHVERVMRSFREGR